MGLKYTLHLLPHNASILHRNLDALFPGGFGAMHPDTQQQLLALLTAGGGAGEQSPAQTGTLTVSYPIIEVNQ